jgi:hypothetical protein
MILIDGMVEECLFAMKMKKMLKRKGSQFKIVGPESKLRNELYFRLKRAKFI